MQNAKY
jgi:two-component system NtrC family sensor kinase